MAGQHPLAALAVARALVGSRVERARAGSRPTSRRRRPAKVFVAEHYSPGLDARQVDTLTRRLRAAVDDGAGSIRFLGAAGLPGDDSFFSIFAAPSLETVATVVARAEVEADRILPALWRAGDGD
jgi:hypothetical protein